MGRLIDPLTVLKKYYKEHRKDLSSEERMAFSKAMGRIVIGEMNEK